MVRLGRVPSYAPPPGLFIRDRRGPTWMTSSGAEVYPADVRNLCHLQLAGVLFSEAAAELAEGRRDRRAVAQVGELSEVRLRDAREVELLVGILEGSASHAELDKIWRLHKVRQGWQAALATAQNSIVTTWRPPGGGK